MLTAASFEIAFISRRVCQRQQNWI